MISDKHRDELVEYVKRHAPISLPAGLRQEMMLLPEQSQFLQHAVEAWAIIEQLRADGGSGIEIIHDNPDFGRPDSAVRLCTDFSDEHTYYGDNALEALRAVLAGKREKEKADE